MQSVKVGRCVFLAAKLSQVTRSSCSSRFASAVIRVGLRGMATASSQPVVIRIPRRMQERIENIKQMQSKKFDKLPTVKPGRLLIKSKNPQLNQSVGYTLGKFEQPVLTSKGWKSNKALGDYFCINSIQSTPPSVLKQKDEGDDGASASQKTFNCFNICPELVETLQSQNIIHPTTVQMQTIPKILKGRNILCAAETGSGKTLAYLLPIIHRLQEEPFTDSERNVRAVVIVPSRELAEQVTSVARSISKSFGLVVKIAGGGRGVGNIKAAFTHGQPDVLVATPGALLKALWKHFINLNELNFLVIDEADTMFDESFAGMLENILSHTEVASRLSETVGLVRKAQLVVVGATFPGGVGEVLGKVTDLASMVTVKSRMLHHLMPHVKQTFLRVKGADKILELHQALKKAEMEHKGVLVFCNSASTVNWLGYSLEEMGVRHMRLQGEMPATMREGIFKNFQKGSVDVLICTDIASRGLDTQRVGLIVNYDFPETHADYIHRAGRVGRAGGSEGGEVLSFVTHPWDVELVQRIETAARRRTSLPGMESEIQKPSHKTDFQDVEK
ncbi:putative ATP-dependent RNA helicase DDX28 [Labeo rohita]|uniref:ATP-dependent RNA helicase n=2 Tax=Labeo rohita TaxID=84645 RepID=A0A498MMQ2_LABRO|nr:probable ATP-dependent RNA helicase DDX28 [Labeo rohita]KAI2662591.1 putative ATP-dependent RNA helicase DDX28 [Labeo rohita]RXN21073.1 putative ATP-dependent RNA helicase DDX28 [Labeo rohita]